MSARHASPLSADEQRQIAEMYAGGTTWIALARLYRRGTTAIKAAIVSCGVPLRSRYEVGRRYKVNESAFDVDSPQSRYWLGFLLADGHIHAEGVSLSLAACDTGHVESFREFMESDYPLKISDTHRTSLVPKAGRQTALWIWSTPLAKSLARTGIGPGKKGAEVPPRLAGDVDFWRGVVDGDGWLQFSRFKYRPGEGAGWYINLGLCGTRAVCSAFADFAFSRVGPRTDGGQYKLAQVGSIWKVNLNGYQAIRMAELLYTDAVVFLPRKKAVADAFAALASNL